MTSFSRVMLSRRGLLHGAVMTSAYVLSAGALQGHSMPGLGRQSTTAAPLAERTSMAVATFFTPSWAQQVSAAFPVQYKLIERAGPSTLTIDWDKRLFAVQDTVTGVSGDAVRDLSVRRSSDHTLKIKIPEDVSELGFRVDVLNEYPNENLADVRGAEFTLADRSGKVLESWRDVPAGVDCEAWSVEATVNWICHEGWIVPARVALASIGPAAAPAGSVVRTSYADVLAVPVLVAPSTPEALNPSSVGEETPQLPATLGQTVADGICDLTLTTTSPLSSGSAIEMLFQVEESNSRPRPFGEFVPRIIFTPPSESTGLRKSERHSDFPVTSSGSQRSTYLPAPTA
ncbi:hypothetical protein ACWPKO_29930 (plasmid) [Coraliomargarita sp. W4R53]